MRKKRNRLPLIFGAILVGTGIYTFIQQAQQAQACGSAQGPIVSGPTISAQTVQRVFMNQSGTDAELQSLGTAIYITAQSNQYQIDDAFAMADWKHEGPYGTQGVAAHTKNIGNITISVAFDPQQDVPGHKRPPNVPYRKTIGYTSAGDHIYQLLPTDNLQTPAAGFIYVRSDNDNDNDDNSASDNDNDSSGLQFPVYNTWQEGIHAWFVRVKGYVDNEGITDYERFAFYYDKGILSPSSDQMANPPPDVASYWNDLKTTVPALRQQNGGGNASGSTSSLQIPDGAWATPAARRDGQKLGLFNCTDTHSMVGAAMNLALHLQFRPCPGGNWCGLFNVWDSSTPQPPAETLGGVVQCVSFVDSVYRMATGKSVPVAPNAGTWWQDYYLDGTEPGFKGIPVASGPPQPGDFIVYWDWDASAHSYQPPHLVNGNWVDFGHIAMIVGVQRPQGGRDGFIIIAQGNADHVLAEQSLSVSGSVWSVGKYDLGQQAQGYIRITSH